MTTVSEIITDAFRESNLIAVGNSPTLKEEAEALRLLNRLLKSIFGNEFGFNLENFPLGKNNREVPASYPMYSAMPNGDWYLPDNKRVVLNLETPITLHLSPRPEDGARFAVVDSSKNLATNVLTLKGNGATIEGANELVLNENGLSRQWFFRSDTNDWVRVSDLELNTVFPFPEEFDDFFIIMLAMRLNPRNATAISPEQAAAFDRIRRQFRSRYNPVDEQPLEKGLIRGGANSPYLEFQRGNTGG